VQNSPAEENKRKYSKSRILNKSIVFFCHSAAASIGKFLSSTLVRVFQRGLRKKKNLPLALISAMFWKNAEWCVPIIGPEYK